MYVKYKEIVNTRKNQHNIHKYKRILNYVRGIYSLYYSLEFCIAYLKLAHLSHDKLFRRCFIEFVLVICGRIKDSA